MTEDEIRVFLDQHALSGADELKVTCRCNWFGHYEFLPAATHRAHVAERLAAALAEESSC